MTTTDVQTTTNRAQEATAFNEAKMAAFVGKVMGDTAGTTSTILASLGDRLGLFKNLAAEGPATSSELAARTGIKERYAREWLAAMFANGYLEYDPTSRHFTLPAEYQPVLAQENGPYFFGGIHQTVMSWPGILDQLQQAFRHGGGVPQSAYSDDMWDGFERFSNGWFENLLLQQWLPAMPDALAALERGAEVADVGCGRGRALIKLAQAFPNSRFVGYDVFAPTIERARANAEAAGVADRIRFQTLDAAQGLPGQYDIITTFDVIHDAVDPRGILRTIRQALRPNGTYICLEINVSDKLEENANPIAAFFYGASNLYCMTTSLAGGGAALGTAGMPEKTTLELCKEAGFSHARRVPLENPFNNLFEARP